MVGNGSSSTVGGRDGSASEREHRWGEPGLHGYVKIGVVAALFCILFRNELERLVRLWTTDRSWSHGFLIPGFSLYFIHQRKNEILRLRWVGDPLGQWCRGRRPAALLSGQTRPSYVGLVILLGALAFYVFNVVSPSGYAYFRPLSMIAALGAVALFLGGWRFIRHTWLPIVFLVFAVPLPRRYYVSLTMPMRTVAADVAAALLSVIGEVEATASGVVIDVVYQGQRLEPALNVAEACSGMRLLMAFLALGVAMAYLHDRPLWQRLVLLASTVPIAMLCNIVRVTATGFIYVLIDPAYTQGVYHDMLGLAMLPLAFAIYGFLAWFMSSLFVDAQEKDSAANVIVRKGRVQ